jgi:hypothetical protein
MSGPSAPAIWEARNLVVAGALAPLLVLTGALGFALPPDWALLSGRPAYNLFHIAGGLAGIALVLQAGGRGAVGFNLAFGLIDLYQAVAGSVDLFPAALFAYRPLDDLLPVTLGLGLVGLGHSAGAGGWRERRPGVTPPAAAPGSGPSRLPAGFWYNHRPGGDPP